MFQFSQVNYLRKPSAMSSRLNDTSRYIPEANLLISISERVYNHDMIQVVTFDHNLKFHIF